MGAETPPIATTLFADSAGQCEHGCPDVATGIHGLRGVALPLSDSAIFGTTSHLNTPRARRWPTPWVFGVLILPLGVYVAYLSTALPAVSPEQSWGSSGRDRAYRLTLVRPSYLDVSLDSGRRCQAAPQDMQDMANTGSARHRPLYVGASLLLGPWHLRLLRCSCSSAAAWSRWRRQAAVL